MQSLANTLGELPAFFIGSRVRRGFRGLPFRARTSSFLGGLIGYVLLLRSDPFPHVTIPYAMAFKEDQERIGRALQSKGTSLHGPGGHSHPYGPRPAAMSSSGATWE